MLSFRQALILGILQGISELFPIPRIGHSIILPALLGWAIDQNSNYFITFLIATHFATAAVLFVIYRDDWARIIGGTSRSIWRRSLTEDSDAKLGWLLVVGTIPAGVVGLLFQRYLQELFASPSYVAAFLALNGLLLYVCERLRTTAHSDADIQDADRRIAAEVS